MNGELNMEKYELTFPQKNIWLVENFYDSKLINIISGSLVIKKEFDISKAEETVNKFVELNDAMRLRICVENGLPKQYVSAFAPFKADKISVEGKTEQEIDSLKKEYISKPIDVIENPLFSYLLIDRGHGVGEIFLKSHHLICDGWSGSKMVVGLAKIYDKILNHETDFDSYPSYLDYIKKEQEYVAGDKYLKDEEFWKEYIMDFKEGVALKNKVASNLKAKRFSVKLNEKLNNIVMDFCKTNKTSPYSVFMTALAIYLKRVTEKEDVIIGTPVLNRGNFNEKQMQGMFVSTMPVRFKINEQDTFIKICLDNARESMTLFRHQRFPYAKTSENYNKNNEEASELFNVMVSYQNARATFERSDAYKMTWNFSGEIQDEFEIHIVDLNDDGILEVDFDYLTDLFDEQEIKYIAERIFAIIEDGIVNDKTVENIEIMSNEEKTIILNNNVTKKYPLDLTIIDIFKNHVKQNPNGIAAICNGVEITYSKLEEMSNAVASYLIDNNIEAGDTVALIQDRSLNMIATIFGIMKCGAAYLPIDTEFPRDRINYILKDSNAKLVIKDIYQKEQQGVNIEEIIEYEDVRTVNNTDASKTAYIIYTSGTTGNPKGVEILHKSLSNLLFAIDDFKHLSDCSVAISQAKYTFDMFVIETLIPIALGIKMVIATEEETLSLDKLLKLLEKNKIEIMFITPTKLNLLLNQQESKNALKNLKKLTVAGEVFPSKLVDRIREVTNTDIYNGYGPTETTVCATVNKVEDSNNITIGKSINNVCAYILDTKGRLLPLNVPGELCIGGEGLFKGYLNNASITTEKTIMFNEKTLYKSGDKCLLNLNNDFEYIGRIDGQVKINGLRIELEEIEKVINNVYGVESSAVCVSNNILIAFIIGTRDTKDVQTEISKVLPGYMIPKYFKNIASLPLSATGKVNKKELLKELKIENKEALNVDYTELQKEIFDIVKTIINIDGKIDVNENLIRYGLDSLSTIELALKLNNKYNINLSSKQIFDKLTINQIENIIRNEQETLKEKQENRSGNNLVPLSDIQKELFVSYKMDTNSTLYNMPGEIVFDEIDANKLKESVKRCINNNVVFKTNVKIYETKPYLEVLDKHIGVSLDEVTESEYEIVKSNFVKPFDLLNDTLVRCNIYIVEGKVHLLYDSHHIIMDGISMGNIISQIEKEYNDEKIDYTYSFIDYLNEYNKEVKADINASENYYKNMLAGKEFSTTIDTDFKRESKRTFTGSRKEVKLDKTLVSRIKGNSEKLKTTENSIFLSALKLLLSKYTYSEDVVLGLAVSGRNKMEHLPVVGMFVNTVPMAEHISAGTKVEEYIKNTQNSIFDSIEHGSYSVQKLVEKLDLKKDSSRNPIFDIVYTYQGFDTQSIMFNNSKLNVNALNDGIAKFDITFEVRPNESNYIVSVEYCNKLYTEDTINNLISSYIKSIESLLENIDGKIEDINIVEAKEKTVNNRYNIPDIITVFNEMVKIYPNNIAIEHNSKTITYKDLDNISTALALSLISKGVAKNAVVGIMLEKSIDFLISILAILKCGAAYLPVDYDLSEERIKFMFDDSGVAGVITRKNIINQKSGLKELKQYNYIDIEELKKHYDNKKEYKIITVVDENDTSYVMYTSGSTGNPKGVMNTHKGVVRLVKNTNYIDVEPTDRVALSGTMVFDASVFETWAALLNGATLDIIDKEELLDITKFENHICNNNVNIMLLTSALFTKFGLNKPEMFKGVKYLITGGDVFSCKAGANVLATCKDTKIINAYGPTENAVIATTYLYDDASLETAPIGKPINNTECYILDRYCKEVPVGAIGELYLGGEGVAKGYINNEKLTGENFIELPFANGTIYKTGDIVKYDNNHDIVFKGRKDNQIKVRGFRVELEEIVASINSIYGVKNSYVTIKTVNDNKQIYAYIAVDDKELYNEKYIRNSLRNKIPYYMQPKFIVILDTLPYNSSGKVDKKLLMLYEPNIKVSLELPRNDLENKVYKIWCTLLGRDDFGINDDFFEIGGDSILATEFVIQCTNQNLNYSYADIYNYPTIKQLCESNSYDLDKIYSLKAYDLESLNEENKKENIILVDTRKDILITGATGFLGSHVLASLLDNLEDEQKIYCLIREKLDVSPLIRLKQRMKFFFEDKYDKLIEERVIVLEGDIVKKDVIYDKTEKQLVIDNVGKVIHTAAYVKHFDDMDMFNKLNVEGTKNIANFCFENKMRLYNVSTLSVCGNMLEGGQVEQDIAELTKYDENSLYIGQKLYNAYVYSKFLAELEILKLCKKGLVATNIRTGNLTGRFTDGKFQPNVEENAFANRIKAFFDLGIVPKSFTDMYLEYTPIDYTAEAMVKLVKNDNSQPRILHLFNDNHIPITKFIEYMKDIDVDLEMVDDDKFKNILKSNISTHNDNMNGIIIDLNSKNEIKYTSNIIVDSKKTKEYLANLGFKWPKIDKDYVIKYIKYLIDIGFFE